MTSETDYGAAVKYAYSAARSSSVMCAAFFQGMATEKGVPPGRTPVRMVWTNSSSVNAPTNGRGFGTAPPNEEAGVPVISEP